MFSSIHSRGLPTCLFSIKSSIWYFFFGGTGGGYSCFTNSDYVIIPLYVIFELNIHVFHYIKSSALYIIFSSPAKSSVQNKVKIRSRRKLLISLQAIVCQNPLFTNSIYSLCLTLWPWKLTFKQQQIIYVKCEYFTNQTFNAMKYTTFCRGI